MKKKTIVGIMFFLEALGAAANVLGNLVGDEGSCPGQHLVLNTSRGAIHVLWPKNVQVHSAGIVVFVHGYFKSAEENWEQYHLADQFLGSRRNAIFIVPQALVNARQAVVWSDLDELLSAVRQELPMELPERPLVLIGHSGAYRTISNWLRHPRVKEIVLLDAFYGQFQEFANWLQDSETNRLILVSALTRKQSETFLRRFTFSVQRAALPQNVAAFSQSEQKTRLLHIKSQYDHFELVSLGRTMPLLLQLCSLADLSSSGVAPVASPSDQS